MTHRVVLHEAPEPGFPTEPLTWKQLGGDLAVVCGNGHMAFLNHDIDVDGYVTPSILCRTPDSSVVECGWHVFARLEGWGT